jgi:hypothetical protein
VEGERHHPAGRRKDAFLFTVILHAHCHRRVHSDPKWGSDRGLLWQGRNSKNLTQELAAELVESMPFPPLYAIGILKKYENT